MSKSTARYGIARSLPENLKRREGGDADLLLGGRVRLAGAELVGEENTRVPRRLRLTLREVAHQVDGRVLPALPVLVDRVAEMTRPLQAQRLRDAVELVRHAHHDAVREARRPGRHVHLVALVV